MLSFEVRMLGLSTLRIFSEYFVHYKCFSCFVDDVEMVADDFAMLCQREWSGFLDGKIMVTDNFVA